MGCEPALRLFSRLHFDRLIIGGRRGDAWCSRGVCGIQLRQGGFITIAAADQVVDVDIVIFAVRQSAADLLGAQRI